MTAWPPRAPESASLGPGTSGGVEAARARARVADVLDRIARIDLQVVVVSPPDVTRLAARDIAHDAAIRAGRGPLFDEAVDAARTTTMAMFARSGFSGTWALTDMAMSVTRAGDRVGAAAAFEDAVMAAVVEDLVDHDTLDVLRATAAELSGMTGMPLPGSLSTIGAPDLGRQRTPAQVALLVVIVALAALAGFAVGFVETSVLFGFAALALAATLARHFRREPG